jgi:hypothetical protein
MILETGAEEASAVKARRGGCACGAVRYEAIGDPVRISVCHCKRCQLRTGSAFGVGCYFPERNLKVLQGALKSFQRTSEAGRWVRTRFCETCGSTVLWEAEAFPMIVAVAGGSFDDTDWFEPKLHVWASAAQKWIHFPAGVEVLPRSNVG